MIYNWFLYLLGGPKTDKTASILNLIILFY